MNLTQLELIFQQHDVSLFVCVLLCAVVRRYGMFCIFMLFSLCLARVVSHLRLDDLCDLRLDDLCDLRLDDLCDLRLDDLCGFLNSVLDT